MAYILQCNIGISAMDTRTGPSFSHIKPQDTQYLPGGLRDFFLYRDLGIAGATNGKVIAPLNLCRGPVWDPTTVESRPAAVRAHASLLLKLSYVRLLDTPLLFDGRPYVKVNAISYAWVTEQDIEELNWTTMPSPQVEWLRIIHALGHGADGRFFLAAQCSKVRLPPECVRF